jgi:hypothetical protein
LLVLSDPGTGRLFNVKNMKVTSMVTLIRCIGSIRKPQGSVAQENDNCQSTVMMK